MKQTTATTISIRLTNKTTGTITTGLEIMASASKGCEGLNVSKIRLLFIFRFEILNSRYVEEEVLLGTVHSLFCSLGTDVVTVSRVLQVQTADGLEQRILHCDVTNVLEVQEADVGSAVEVLEVHLGIKLVLVSDLSEVHFNIVGSVKPAGDGGGGAVLHHEFEVPRQKLVKLELERGNLLEADIRHRVLRLAQGGHVHDEVELLAAPQENVGDFLETGRGGEVLVLSDDLTEGFPARGLVIKSLTDTFHLPGTETRILDITDTATPPTSQLTWRGN